MSEIKEKKYAVILGGRRLTDYIYDDVVQSTNTLYGIKHEMMNLSTIHAYSKQDGKLLFKKDVEDYKFFEECMIIQVTNKLNYIFFDSCQKIIGPFYEVEIKRRLIKVGKLVNNVLLYGAYDAKGNLVLPIKYQYIWDVSDKLVEVGSKKGKSGLVNYHGDYILEPTCGEINYYFNDTFITFYNAQKYAYGAINEDGKALLECEYDDIEVHEVNELIYIKKDGLYGICKHGEGIIFNPTFRCYERNREVVELIGIDDKTYGYIPKLNLLLPRRYYAYYKNYLKYFDGYKWRKLKYDKK